MSVFANLNKSFESPFTVNPPEDAEYKKLSDLIPNAIYTMVSCYINPKSKFGEHGIAGVIDTDGVIFNLSLPKHLNDVVTGILGDETYIDGVNAGECKFKIKSCHSNKYNRDFITIEFI